jgi:enoyl-CoA hydratase/carnithine racemase
MGESEIHVETTDGVAVVVMDRPEKLNALSVPMLRDLGEALREAGRPGTDATGIVLTGAGRAFSAGDDLPATEALDAETFEGLIEHFQALTRIVLASEVPVVAALNGIAVGGAAELALVCDARVGFAGSDWLFPENDVGLTISNGASAMLPRFLGSRALPIVLSARRIPGEEARSLGLIDEWVDSADEVRPAAVALVRRWADRGLATRWHLRLLRPSLDEIDAAIAREDDMAREVWASGAPREGIRRFLAGRESRRAR